jgi:hypothetical protein
MVEIGSEPYALVSLVSCQEWSFKKASGANSLYCGTMSATRIECASGSQDAPGNARQLVGKSCRKLVRM